jgi:NAD dependent epimerase/dehydratase family enzyme
MADEMLLASQRVRPAVLESAGFQFQHAQLADCFKAILK